MAHLITGYAGEAHIKSSDQGSYNAAFFGSGQHVLEIGQRLDAEITDNNTVTIQDGDILMYGRHIRVPEAEEITIQTGTAGKNRIDLIVMQYEKDNNTGIETAAFNVIQGTETSGTPTVPQYTNGNILEDALLNQMPIYKVKIEGVVLSEITAMFTKIPTYQALAAQYEAEFIAACQSHLDSLNVLDSKAAIMANTEENQLTGALALKETINAIIDTKAGIISNTAAKQIAGALALKETINDIEEDIEAVETRIPAAIVDSVSFYGGTPTWDVNTDDFKDIFPYKYTTGLVDISVADNDIPIWEIMIVETDDLYTFPNGIRPPKTANEKKAIDAIQYAVFQSGYVTLYATELPPQGVYMKIVCMI